MSQKIWIENGVDVDPTWEKHIAYSHDNVIWHTINKEMLGVEHKTIKKNTTSPIADKSITYGIVIRQTNSQGYTPTLEFDLANVQNQAGWTVDNAGLIQAIADITEWLSQCCGFTAEPLATEETLLDLLEEQQSVHKAEDSGHVSGDKGIMALAVRNEGQADLGGSERDYTPISVDRKGNLLSSSVGKMNRITGSSDYSRTFTYHGTGDENVITIVHTGTTPHGSETITETISYVDPSVNGSNITSIVYS